MTLGEAVNEAVSLTLETDADSYILENDKGEFRVVLPGSHMLPNWAVRACFYSNGGAQYWTEHLQDLAPPILEIKE